MLSLGQVEGGEEEEVRLVECLPPPQACWVRVGERGGLPPLQAFLGHWGETGGGVNQAATAMISQVDEQFGINAMGVGPAYFLLMFIRVFQQG